jgi:hypothetical protein
MRILVSIYVLVAVALGGYALHGTAGGAHWPFLLWWGGLTLGWLVAYWPVAMPLYVLARLRAIWLLVVEHYQATGKWMLDTESRAFLLDELVGLVAQQYGLPSFVAQWVVSKLLGRLRRMRGGVRREQK